MILVVGDFMIDEYVHVAIDRISPEAPVPVMRELRREWMPGGAGNVAANIASMGDDVKLMTVVGPDFRMNIKPWMGWIVDDKRCTTIKTRFVAERGQQVARLDKESSQDIDHLVVARLNDNIKLDGVSVVVISDYGKGVVTPSFARLMIDNARARDIPVIVNAKSHFRKFGGATIVTCNEREWLSSGADHIDRRSLVFVTRGADGIQVHDVGAIITVSAPEVQVGDVTGAGDTVVAALAVYVKRHGLRSLEDAACFACRAASVAVSHRGTHAVTMEEIEQ